MKKAILFCFTLNKSCSVVRLVVQLVHTYILYYPIRYVAIVLWPQCRRYATDQRLVTASSTHGIMSSATAMH